MKSTNYRRLVLCLACLGSLASLQAQTTDPSRSLLETAQLHQDYASANYLGYLHDLPQLGRLPLEREHAAYRQMLATLMLQRTDHPEELVNRFLTEHPQSLDRAEAQLLLGLIYLEQGHYSVAQEELRRVPLSALAPREAAQLQLALGYSLLKDRRGMEQLAEAKAALEQAADLDGGLVGAQATLYLGTIAQLEGKTELARELFRPESYPEALRPEAACQLVLLQFATLQPEAALSATQPLLRSYPSLSSRPDIRGAQGQAHFALGSYAEAVRYLQPLLSESGYEPNAGERYALGASLYALGRYDETLKALEGVETDKAGDYGAKTLFVQANSLLKLGQSSAAALAFSRAAAHPAADRQLREAALYNGVLLQYQTQRANFGQTVRAAEAFVKEYPQSKHHAEVLGLMKRLFLTNKDYSQSLATLQRLQLQSRDLDEAKQYVLLRLGEDALSKGRYPEAEQRLSEGIKLATQPDYTAQCYLLRALTYLQEGRYAESAHDVQHSRSAQFSVPLSAYVEGYAYYNAKRYSEAQRAFTSYLSQASSEPTARRVDALCRRADSYLVQHRSKEALEDYRAANELAPGGNDEALYRMAAIQGRWGNYGKQIESLDLLARLYPESAHLPEVLYDKGRAQILSKAPVSEAQRTFSQLIQRYPETSYARLGALELGMVSYNAGRHEEAIKAYKDLIARYPDSEEARSALSDLKNIYIDLDRVDEYSAYASTLGKQLSPSEEEGAHLQYLSLESKYKKDKEGTIAALENYVRAYPKSRDAGKAELLLARHYEETQRSSEATALYTKLAEPARSLDLRIPALEALAQLQKSEGKLAASTASWSKLYALEGLEAPQKIRYGVQLAASAHEAKDYKRSLAVTSELLKRSDLGTSARSALILIKGKSEEASGATGQALKTYEALLKQGDSPEGAEGIVRHADLLLRSGKPAEARKSLDSFIAAGTTQQYWLARAFLLLADCYQRTGETYLAKQYVESLRDNYKGSEEDIQRMISERLASYK